MWMSVRAGLVALAVSTMAGPALADRASDLAAALTAARAGDWDGARAIARGLPDQPARDVITWMDLRDGNGSFEQYRAFLDRRSDWPGLPLLRARGEAAIPDGVAPDQVLAYFADHAPRTGTGALQLAAARAVTGDAAGARSVIVTAWQTLTLTAEEEDAIVTNWADTVAPHHTARLDHLLWEGERAAALRMLPRVPDDWQKLATARLRLRAMDPGVDAAIAAVPATLAKDPGLAYERFLWRDRKDRDRDAADFAISLSGSADTLGRPEIWAERRRNMARALMRAGDDRRAYRLAATHRMPPSDGYSAYSDLEWLAGFIALRKLNDPAAALAHFQRFRATIASPISISRADYWIGRAQEALGSADAAQAAYAQAARHQTAFYGQLAADRGNIAPDPALTGDEVYPDWRDARFMSSSVLRAALFLQEAGDRALSTRFMVHLCERLTVTEMGSLADLALYLEEPYTALKIAKYAARDGAVLHRAYHPVVSLTDADLPIPQALALAIARRESEFNPAVISHAGARGLMQVMPATGKDAAGRLGIPYVQSKLLSDPEYNARLASEYLSWMRERFGENLALLAVAYNAGPTRASRWRDRYGDPTRASIDVIDWIEHVPFRETRNYIMRVTESVLIYEARLGKRVRPFGVEDRLKGRD